MQAESTQNRSRDYLWAHDTEVCNLRTSATQRACDSPIKQMVDARGDPRRPAAKKRRGRSANRDSNPRHPTVGREQDWKTWATAPAMRCMRRRDSNRGTAPRSSAAEKGGIRTVGHCMHVEGGGEGGIPDRRPLPERAGCQTVGHCTLSVVESAVFQTVGHGALRVAERAGFEPAVELLTPRPLSKRLPSTTRPPLPYSASGGHTYKRFRHLSNPSLVGGFERSARPRAFETASIGAFDPTTAWPRHSSPCRGFPWCVAIGHRLPKPPLVLARSPCFAQPRTGAKTNDGL